MRKTYFQVAAYIVAIAIPFIMLKAVSWEPPVMQSLGYLFVFPFFAVPILTLLYFSSPVYALGILVFATVVGFCGMMVTIGDFREWIPSPVIFLVQTFWLWYLFWRGERLLEMRDTDIHRLQEDVEKLELEQSDYQNQALDAEKFCEGISERVRRYFLLQAFTDEIASVLDVRKIQDKTEFALRKFFSEPGVQVQMQLFTSVSGDGGSGADPVTEWMLKHHLPLLVPDCSEDARFSHYGSDRKVGCILAGPIEKENVVIGVVKVESPSAELWNEDDLRYLADLSSIISLSVANALYYEKAESLAVKDSLTGLFVRYRFDERLVEEFSRAQANRSPLSLILFDIDHFKQVNDQWGHEAGDQVLKSVSKIILTQTRETDFCCRYGGEEIAVIMPLSGPADAYRTAERVRARMAREQEEIRVTISGGVGTVSDEHRVAQDLVNDCDQALYRAKESGRNKIVKALGKTGQK